MQLRDKINIPTWGQKTPTQQMGIIVARSAHSLQFEAGVGRGRFMSAESIYREPGCKYMLEGSGVRV